MTASEPVEAINGTRPGTEALCRVGDAEPSPPIKNQKLSLAFCA